MTLMSDGQEGAPFNFVWASSALQSPAGEHIQHAFRPIESVHYVERAMLVERTAH